MEPPSVTEGDVLSAWWACLSLAHLPANSKRMVCLNNGYEFRPVLSDDLLRSGRPLLSNAVHLVTCLVRASDVSEKSVSWLAWQVRRSIRAQRRREQVEAHYAFVRASRRQNFFLFGDHTLFMVSCSNWKKGNLFETDFSAAVAEKRVSASSRAGKPTYVQHYRIGAQKKHGDSLLMIVGRDEWGNYWLDGCIDRKLWRKAEEMIAEWSVRGGNRKTGDLWS
ncbi:hypothetical protein CDD83_6512 [Cordyceps sp. RAO-2017]|nr:hypothetical protein CDD83_6512 [Cordyceps sp. RAO-2017]